MYSRSSLLYWGCLLRTLVSASSSAFSASWAWLRLDHKTLLQQKVAPVSFNTPSPKSLDSLCSKRVCEQVEMPPELPSIHFAEYLGTGESNCGSNFLSVWCLKLKSWCWDGFELSESESKSLFCAYCMIQLIFLLKIFFTSAYGLLESFDRGQSWFAIKWNFSKQSLCPLKDLVCRRSDFGTPVKTQQKKVNLLYTQLIFQNVYSQATRKTEPMLSYQQSNHWNKPVYVKHWNFLKFHSFLSS